MHEQWSQLRKLAAQLDEHSLISQLDQLLEWRQSGTFHVVFCGEFKRGKSTLVNALLGQSISPTGVLPTTAVPILFHFSEQPEAFVEWLDGRKEQVEPTEAALSSFSVDGSPEESSRVRLIHVGLPAPILRSGLSIIDTPGVNDLSQQRGDITYGFLPLADAAVVVLDATAPLTRSESQFLTKQVFPAMLDRFLFVLGKIDRLDEEEDEIEEAVEGATERLARELGQTCKVWPVSALTALKKDSSYLSDFTQALRRLESNNLSHRDKLFEKRLLNLAEDFLYDLEQRVLRSKMSEQEIQATSIKFREVQGELSERLGSFFQYIESYGRATLKDLVQQSLKQLEEELTERTLHQIDLCEGRVEDLVQKQIPFQVTSAVKSWGEHKGPEIQTFLERFMNRVIEDFQKAFDAPLNLASLPTSLDAPTVERIQNSRKKANKMGELLTQELLPTTLPAAAGVLLFGPLGMLGGLVLGRMAGQHLRESQLEQKRKEAATIVRAEIPITIQGFTQAMCEQIDLWFQRLESELKQAFLARATQIEQQLLQPSFSDEALLSSIKDEVGMITKQLKQILGE